MMKHEENSVTYENNPLKLAWQGVKKFKLKSKITFLVLVVLSILSASSNLLDPGTPPEGGDTAGTVPEPGVAEVLFMAGLFLFMFFVLISLAIVLWGIVGYSASQLAKDKKFTLKEAFEESLNNFERLFLVGLVAIIRIFLWSLLFIIPGIIMAVRYSLSAVVAFSEPDLQPNKVVSRSAQLTKGAWFHTFGTRYLLSMLTLGLIDIAVDAAAQSKLYNQLTALKENGVANVKTHVLSYLTLLIPFLVIGLLYALLGQAFIDYMMTGNM